MPEEVFLPLIQEQSLLVSSSQPCSPHARKTLSWSFLAFLFIVSISTGSRLPGYLQSTSCCFPSHNLHVYLTDGTSQHLFLAHWLTLMEHALCTIKPTMMESDGKQQELFSESSHLSLFLVFFFLLCFGNWVVIKRLYCLWTHYIIQAGLKHLAIYLSQWWGHRCMLHTWCLS